LSNSSSGTRTDHSIDLPESSLLQKLEALDESHPRNLVILAQSHRLHQHTKRQVSTMTNSRILSSRSMLLTFAMHFMNHFVLASHSVRGGAVVIQRQLDRAHRRRLCQVPGKHASAYPPFGAPAFKG